MKRALVRLVAPLAVVAIVGTACGSKGDKANSSSATTTTEQTTTSTMADHSTMGSAGATATPTATPAATLRAGLTALLQEHVYLAGVTTATALSGGDLKVPAAALDKNSVGLSDAIKSVYGQAAGDQFLALWRKHIGFFVDYTTGKATKDQAKVTKAQQDLDGYRADFDAFLTGANPNLPKGSVAQELIGHVQTLEAAIDAQAAKDMSQYDKLAVAATHMPMTADVLAGAIAKQFPEKFAG
jgi:hypothetical protein